MSSVELGKISETIKMVEILICWLVDFPQLTSQRQVKVVG